MDKKKEWIMAINYGKYLAFIIATILVIIFQFVGSSLLLKFTLVVYVASFGLTFTSLVFHAHEVSMAAKSVKDQKATLAKPKDFEQGMVDVKQGELKGEKAEVVSLKYERFWTIFGAVASALFMIFTFVVLVIY